MENESTIQELYSSENEQKVRDEMLLLLKGCPIPDNSLLSNLGLFLNSKNLSRILMMDYLYRQILGIHGIVMDFGTRWGQNAALFSALRGIYEPFNRHRKIVAFDTFDGFPEIGEWDNKNAPFAHTGGLTTTPGYPKYLEQILRNKELDNPAGHIQKFEVVVGDTSQTIHTYLERNPETIVSLAYFDFDIFQPTRDCLYAIDSLLLKGAVVAFDELCDHDSHGETTAFFNYLQDKKVKLQRLPYVSRISYYIVE